MNEIDSERRRLIIKISDQILSYLLNYRKSNPDFVFYLRQRDFYKSRESRFSSGFWFQGSDYIWFSPYDQGDDHNKTRSIGFVVGFDAKNKILLSREISFGAPNNSRFVSFHREIAKWWLGDEIEKGNYYYRKFYEHNDIEKALKDFILRDKPFIDRKIEEFGFEEFFFLTKKKFNRLLSRTLEKRKEIYDITETLIPDIELEGYEGEIKEELKFHKRRERDRKFVANYKELHKTIKYCPACNTDIEGRYGFKAIDILELHHILPLSKKKTSINSKIKPEDVLLLCPTCHRAIHKLMSKESLEKIDIEEFKDYLNDTTS